MAKKILIIEDEEVLAQMYKEKFEQEGLEVDLAFSCQEAIDYLKNNKPDLILLDILLPQENGISFLEKIKKDGTAEKIPIVAFSNYDEPATKKEAFALGAKDYLIKTQYTPSQLLKKIREFLK